MTDRLEELRAFLQELGKITLAFSGGVDSSFLLRVAIMALGKENVYAITMAAPYVPQREVDEAIALAKELGAQHEVVKVELQDELKEHPANACYVCKRYVFGQVIARAQELGYPTVIDGTNKDDLGEYRPGLKALKEYEVVSPLAKLGFSKAEITALSKELGLETWDKPSYSCLLSRLEVGKTVELDDLARVEQAEVFLNDLGFYGLRVRLHGDLVRIELRPQDLAAFSKVEIYEKVVARFKELGFGFITLDLEGYRTGSMAVEEAL